MLLFSTESMVLSRAYPGPHPEPPFDLEIRGLPISSLSNSWFRLHRIDRDALFFGSTGTSRFDAPAGQYGVLYAADTPHCAFIETFGQSTGVRVVTRVALERRCLSHIEIDRALRLVDLTGPGLARLGADNRLCTADHGVAQQWALALWEHPQKPDGLLYRARHDPSRLCAAIYDRAASAVSAVRIGSLADSGQVHYLAEILDTYQFGLLDNV
jgi:hypothetical protein